MKKKLLAVTFLISYLIACQPEAIEIEADHQFGQLPDKPVVPNDNAQTGAKIWLGKNLFWDPILSGNKDIACVTCHHPQSGYAEQLELSIGVGGRGLSESRSGGVLIERNSQTIINTAYNGIDPQGFYQPTHAEMFWDNRSLSLEKQAIEPILSENEMRGLRIPKEAIFDTVVYRLREIQEYQDLFRDAFGEQSINIENIGKAIAAFERSIVANKSRFDQFIDGDREALTSVEIRGMINFAEVGCSKCHNGPMFSDYQLHVLSVPESELLIAPDEGDGHFAFRTPSLRNLSITAPYMHNGVFNSLDDVLEFYEDVDDGSRNPNVEEIDEILRELNLTDDKISSIVAFLKSLDDLDFDKEELKVVPSKLPPGGNIY